VAIADAVLVVSRRWQPAFIGSIGQLPLIIVLFFIGASSCEAQVHLESIPTKIVISTRWSNGTRSRDPGGTGERAAGGGPSRGQRDRLAVLLQVKTIAVADRHTSLVIVAVFRS